MSQLPFCFLFIGIGHPTNKIKKNKKKLSFSIYICLLQVGKSWPISKSTSFLFLHLDTFLCLWAYSLLINTQNKVNCCILLGNIFIVWKLSRKSFGISFLNLIIFTTLSTDVIELLTWKTWQFQLRKETETNDMGNVIWIK